MVVGGVGFFEITVCFFGTSGGGCSFGGGGSGLGSSFFTSLKAFVTSLFVAFYSFEMALVLTGGGLFILVFSFACVDSPFFFSVFKGVSGCDSEGNFSNSFSLACSAARILACICLYIFSYIYSYPSKGLFSRIAV